MTELLARPRAKPLPRELPYRVICISLYLDDIEDLDVLVAECKERGLTKANRSAIIRYALNRISADQILAEARQINGEKAREVPT